MKKIKEGGNVEREVGIGENMERVNLLVNHKVNYLLIFSLILFILLISNVYALGVSPARTTINFESGLKKEVPFSVINSENKDMSVFIFVRGELNESISLNKVYDEFNVGEESKSFSYTVNLPAKIEKPGLHEAEIVVMEMPKNFKEKGVVVGASVAVITGLHVYVPYPGKYLELESQILNANENGVVLFLIAATNRGKVDVKNAKARIEIYNLNNEKVAVLESDEREINSNDRVELVAKWSENVKEGEYIAKISVNYDGELATSEKYFKVGNKIVEIISIEVNDFKLGGIAKFNALVENKWTNDVKNSYLNLKIFNSDNEVMADIKSPTYDIKALSKENMIAYWDTIGVKKGTYDGNLALMFSGGSVDKDVKVKISENQLVVMGISGEVIIEKIKGGNFQKFLIIAVIILALLNISWFIVFKKMFGNKNLKEHVKRFTKFRGKGI